MRSHGFWTDEIHKVTEDFYQTQKKASLTQLLHGNQKAWDWPDKWIPYFGGNPNVDVIGNPDWRKNPVVEPYTLYFISTGKWWINLFEVGTQWMASFDPGYHVETKIVKWKTGIRGQDYPPVDLRVDFRCPAHYAEDKHKDDVATLKKKWKYL